MLKTYQKMQTNRLAEPKRGHSINFGLEGLEQTRRSYTNLVGDDEPDSPRSNFLRRTTQGANFGMRKSPSLDGMRSGAGSPRLNSGRSLENELA